MPSNRRSDTGPDSKIVRKRLSIPIAISSPRLIDISSPPSTGTSPLCKFLKPYTSPDQAHVPLARSPSSSFSLSGGSKLKAPNLRSPISSAGSVFSLPTSAEKRRNTLHLTTPKTFKEQTMPQAIPALKIVKRPRPNGHERNDSTSSMPGPSNGAKLKRMSVPTIPSATLDLPTIVPLRMRKAAVESESPQTVELEAQPTQQVVKTRSLLPPRPPVPPTQMSGPGPRRVPISEGPQLKSAPRATTMPVPSVGGPRRVIAPSTSVLPSTQSRLLAPSGLKPPTQLGTVAAPTTTSSLPKPVSRISTLTSRLPAPRTLKSGGLPTLRRAT